MAYSVADSTHRQVLNLAVTAEWRWVDIPPGNDHLGQDYQLTDAAEPPSLEARPTMCIPVKRTTLNVPSPIDTYPALQIHVEVIQEFSLTALLNFSIPGFLDKDVKVYVQNIYGIADAPEVADAPRHSNPGLVRLTGRLKPLVFPSGSAGLGCDIEVSPQKVAQFMDFKSALKARINENLLDFQIEIAVGKDVLQGRSKNLVFLYRRKTIVFLPGVFGSRFAVQTSDGTLAAFPNSQFDAGVMECDSQGNPLLPAANPTLLRLGVPAKAAVGTVVGWTLGVAAGAISAAVASHIVFAYDAFQKLHEARVKKLPRLPQFLLYELRVFAYDWRGDLRQTATEMLNRLRLLRNELSKMPDSDDQIALAGHSTGGLIIRWLMSHPDLTGLVSHVFFCNVPFRGAPKALGVFLTGCDPPGGDRMIKIVGPNSMRNIAPSMPIVYHLAPSNSYSSPVAEGEGIWKGARTREEEKAALMNYAVQTGIYFPRPSVKKAPFSLAECERLAMGSEYWGKFVDELTVRMAARTAFSAVGGAAAIKFFDWAPNRILSDPALILQIMERLPDLWNRFTGGTNKFNAGTMTGRQFIEAWLEEAKPWNEKLAEKARVFHQESETAAAKGAWAEKAYIFYSNTKDGEKKPTTSQIKVTYFPPGKALGYRVPDYPEMGLNWLDDVPPEPSDKHDVRTVEQWGEGPGLGYWKYTWLLSAATTEGDSTVPISSQLGFGGPAKAFKPLLGGPEHAEAPNKVEMWERAIEVLLGEDVEGHLAKNVDTVQGVQQ